MVANILQVKIKIFVLGTKDNWLYNKVLSILDYMLIFLLIRRERNICEICWATTAEGDFELTGALTGAAGSIPIHTSCIRSISFPTLSFRCWFSKSLLLQLWISIYQNCYWIWLRFDPWTTEKWRNNVSQWSLRFLRRGTGNSWINSCCNCLL